MNMHISLSDAVEACEAKGLNYEYVGSHCMTHLPTVTIPAALKITVKKTVYTLCAGYGAMLLLSHATTPIGERETNSKDYSKICKLLN